MRQDPVPPSACHPHTDWRATGSRLRRLAGTSVALLLTAAPVAAQVVINPVVVEFGARQRTASITVSLSESAPAAMRLQAEVLGWQQDLQGRDITRPSSDLLVTPPIAELRPGQKQLFRVALRGARPGPDELAYRLILEDIAAPVPPPAAPGEQQQSSIQFRMRYDLPVLIAPSSPVVQALFWKPCSATARGSACVRVHNAGNRRVKLQSLTLTGDGWQDSLDLGDGVNVLAGAEREWQLVLGPGHGGAPRGLQVRTVTGQVIQVEAGGG